MFLGMLHYSSTIILDDKGMIKRTLLAKRDNGTVGHRGWVNRHIMDVRWSISCVAIGCDACPSLSSEGASSHMRKKNEKPFLHDELTSLFLLLFC